MKMTTLKSVAIAVGLASSAFGQATSPVVGYETITLQTNDAFNLAGARLHGKIVQSGTFTASTATTLTETGADFSGLTAAAFYSVELADGTSIIAQGSEFSGETLTIASGGLAGLEQAYDVREASTLDSIFGATNSAGLTESATGDPTVADIVWVPSGSGFEQFYYVNIPSGPSGWFPVGSTTPAGSTTVIAPGVGFLIQTQGASSPSSIVVSGALKTSPTSYMIGSEFNLLSGVYPAGETLDESNLEGFVAQSATGDPTIADILFLPSGSGFNQYYFVNIPSGPSGWFEVGSTTDIGSTVELTSGFYIQDRDSSGAGTLSAPSFYATL